MRSGRSVTSAHRHRVLAALFGVQDEALGKTEIEDLLEAGEPWRTGGPDQEVSIVIEDPSVSNFHAKLVHKKGRWKIVDQMSTNHTYVNGEQYNSAFLSSKDSIRFGLVEAVFLLPETPTTNPPPDVVKTSFITRLFRFFKK